MKSFPRPTLLAAAVLSLCLSAPALAQDPATAAPKAPPEMSHALSAVDQKVLGESVRAGYREVEAARLAQARSGNSELREAAAQLERDKTELNTRLESVMGGVRPFGASATASGANHNNYPVDTTPVTTYTDPDLSRLESLQGDAFDAAWLQLMIDGQIAAVDRFRSGSEFGGAEVQALSNDALPIVRRHLSRLESIQKKSL